MTTDMNRRSFMKKVGGALAGVVALALPSKDKRSLAVEQMLNDKRISHTLFTGWWYPNSANIDPNSEWANERFRMLDYGLLNPPFVLEFKSGELSPMLQGRVDMKKYSSVCKSLKHLKYAKPNPLGLS